MLARYLRCHPSTIYRLLKGKEIPAFKIGSDWRFQKSTIENWLRKGTIHTASR
jgi:excisionase family DNA binding protein